MHEALIIVVFLSRVLWMSSSPTEDRWCRPGFFHNVTIDRCQVCPSGTYASTYNLNSHCDRCSTCTGLRVMVAACNAISDVVCKCPDEYYEHDDGCSPLPRAEVRSPEKPEWTWTEYLLIVTSASVVIIFTILLVMNRSYILKKLRICPRNCRSGSMKGGKRRSRKQGVAGDESHPLTDQASEARQPPKKDPILGATSADPGDMTQTQANVPAAAASGNADIAPSTSSVTGAAVDGASGGEASKLEVQASVQVDINNLENVALEKLRGSGPLAVNLPKNTESRRTETPSGDEGASDGADMELGEGLAIADSDESPTASGAKNAGARVDLPSDEINRKRFKAETNAYGNQSEMAALVTRNDVN